MVSARLFGVAAGRRSWPKLGALTLVAAGLAGCAQPPDQSARRHTKEYFSEAQYGHASPRVIADGEPVPHGGGQYLVGHAYTIAGRTYYPGENTNYSAVGMASWYGDAFHGRRTANGEIYDMHSLTAAHPTMPLPSYARVTNLANGYSVVVRVNDRGPFHGGRVMDVSSRVADVLNFKGTGTAKIKVEFVGRAPLEGDDTPTLLASLRTDGAPAMIGGMARPVAVASAQESAPSILPGFLRPKPAAPPPAPPPPPAAPQPEAAEAEAPAEEAVAPRPRLINPPAPPPRPFDLGAIERTIGPVASAPARDVGPLAIAPATPPRRPLQQASAERALYFATDEGSPARLLQRRDPFAKLLEQGKLPRVEASYDEDR
ncbi:MAG: septal ring lytic transglycosylase RlpA family protein [Hyphomicrobiales bacterium]|nr:septal ring lytic transglycosylase RlpA family protein [Hyphomicrobiales bacterium]